MNQYKTMLPYLGVNALAFYLLPLVVQDTGSAMAVMLVMLPAVCLITALIFGVKQSFHWLYALAVALLFVPTIFLFYNESATAYTFAYGVIALAGNGIGAVFHHGKKHDDRV